MTEGTSRKGIRLPWLGDEVPLGATEPSDERVAPPEQPASAATVAASPAASPAPQAAVEESGPFLQDLVDAMRQITEEARDEALMQLRAAVAERTTDLTAATDERAAELQELADAEILRIAEWEKGELQRVRDEASAKVSARRTRLESQLNANMASGDSARSAVQARIEAFEREMAGFFAQLNDLHDPVAFASAVKRMPRPPSLADTPAGPAGHIAPTPEATPTPQAIAAPPVSPPAWPREPASETSAVRAIMAASVDASSEPVTAAPAVAAPATDGPAPDVTAPPDVDEVTTQVLVTGLSSFGAITSFKQSLERVVGVHRVSMGLGTSGEFIFTAAHAAGFDLAAAIRSFESSAQFVTTGDQLRVTVGSKN